MKNNIDCTVGVAIKSVASATVASKCCGFESCPEHLFVSSINHCFEFGCNFLLVVTLVLACA